MSVFFTKEQITEIEKVSILDYLQQTGVGTILSDSQRYAKIEINGHDSVIVDKVKNIFFHNGNITEKNAKGNVIDFLKYFQNVSFTEALNILSDTKFKHSNFDNTFIKKEYVYDKNEEVLTTSKARNYLVNVRKINDVLVDNLIQSGYIAQNKYGAAVFKWFEPYTSNPKIIGHSIQGTVYDVQKYGKRGTFKKIESGSDLGFHFTKGIPENLYVFESTIDALSYYSLNPQLNNFTLFSMEGLKEQFLLRMIHATSQVNQVNQLKVFLSVDNDDAGKQFTEHIINTFNNTFESVDGIFKTRQENKTLQLLSNLPGENYKDYNEMLVGKLLADKVFQIHLGNQSAINTVKNFLVNDKHIDKFIVNKLFEKGLLKADELNRAVFLWEKNNKLVGGQLMSAEFDKKRFKGGYFEDVLNDSDPDGIFRLKFGKNADRLFVFKNPIDLLSFYTMYRQEFKKLQNGVVCMCLNNQVKNDIKQILKHINDNITPNMTKVSFCFDKTDKGFELTDSIKNEMMKKDNAEQYEALYEMFKNKRVKNNVPKQEKDWETELDTFYKYDDEKTKIQEKYTIIKNSFSKEQQQTVEHDRTLQI